MSDLTLLPPNATPLERALAKACAMPHKPEKIRRLWSPQTCPFELLPWLAWAWSMDDWDPSWTEAQQRAIVAASANLHKKKGTPWAIREVVRRLNLGEVELIAGLAGRTRNGTIRRDGLYVHGDGNAWSRYRVILKQPITNDQAARLRSLLDAYAPARCQLAGLEYQAAVNSHNGAIRRNGQYNRGTA